MGGDGTWSGERKRAEPEGGQYCDSRWKFLFEETAFSAALLITFLKSLHDIWKVCYQELMGLLALNYISSLALHFVSMCV